MDDDERKRKRTGTYEDERKRRRIGAEDENYRVELVDNIVDASKEQNKADLNKKNVWLLPTKANRETEILVQRVEKTGKLTPDIMNALAAFRKPNTIEDEPRFGLFKIMDGDNFVGLFYTNPGSVYSEVLNEFKNADDMVEFSIIVDPYYRGRGYSPASKYAFMRLNEKEDRKLIPFFTIDPKNSNSLNALKSYNSYYANDDEKMEKRGKYYTTKSAISNSAEESYTEYLALSLPAVIGKNKDRFTEMLKYQFRDITDSYIDTLYELYLSELKRR
jgi:hypothetical protein